MNTQAACNTGQDITWMHAADKTMNCVQHHKTHVDRRASSRANSRPHTHTKRQNVERESLNQHETETQDMSAGIWTPRSNMKCRWDSAWLERARSRMLTWKQDMTGVSGLCHKTMNNTRPKRQNPDKNTVIVYNFIHNINIYIYIYIYIYSIGLTALSTPTSHTVTQSALKNQPISTPVSIKAEYTIKQLSWKHRCVHVEYSGTAHFCCMCYALIHSDSEDAIRYLYSVIYFLLTQTCSALWHNEHNLP